MKQVKFYADDKMIDRLSELVLKLRTEHGLTATMSSLWRLAMVKLLEGYAVGEDEKSELAKMKSEVFDIQSGRPRLRVVSAPAVSERIEREDFWEDSEGSER